MNGKESMCQVMSLLQGSVAYSSLRERVIMMSLCEIMRSCNVFYSLVDAGGVPSLSVMFLDIKNHC